MAFGRIWSAGYSGTVTNAGGNADIFELLPGDDKPCRIRGIRLGNSSEVGDTAEEGLEFSIIRMTATVTSSNGTGLTAEAVDASGQAPTFTVEANGATVATTSGDTEILERFAWNIRNSPFEIWYPDVDFAPKAVQGQGLFVRMNTTPADDFTFSGTIWIEEG